MELTQEQLAEIKAQIKAEMEVENRKGELDRALQRQRSSALQGVNGSQIRENYGARPSDTAALFGTLLWDQMDKGLLGTAIEDDGYGGLDGE